MPICNLPDSLLIEILKRLPCQHVFRCKSVCRHWCSLISDSFFIRSFIHHHQRLKHSSPFTLVHQFRSYYPHDTKTAFKKIYAVSEHSILQPQDIFIDFPHYFRYPDGPWPIVIIASHEDLIVCHVRVNSDQSMYYVCNLLTKQWQAFPPIPDHRCVKDNMAIGLVTYGEDLLVCKHKVVRIFKLGHQNNDLIAEIYSSDTGKWSKSILSCPVRQSFFLRTSSVTLNGALHCIINSSYGETILVFDPFSGANGQCRLIDIPLELKFQGDHYCFGTCREKLRMSTLKVVSAIFPDHILSVWELQNYDRGEWFLPYRICLNDMVLVTDRQFNMLSFSASLVLCFHPNDGDVVYLKCHEYIWKCNMKKATLEVVSKSLRDRTSVMRIYTAFPLLHPCWPTAVIGPKPGETEVRN